MSEEEHPPSPPESALAQARSGSGTASEISRRVGAILDAVEHEASRLREEARAEAGRYLEHAQRRADALVDERRRRIAHLSDELIAKSEAVVARLDDAAPVRQGFENLVRALGDAAERLSQESKISQGNYEPPPSGGTATAPSEAASLTRESHAGQGHDARSQQASPPTYAQPPQQEQPVPARYQPSTSQPGSSGPPQPIYADPAVAQGRTDTPSAQPHPARAPSPPGWGSSIASGAETTPRNPPSQRDVDWQALDDARMIAIQMASSGATRAGVREHMYRTLAIADTTPILDEVFGPGSGEEARVPWASAPG